MSGHDIVVVGASAGGVEALRALVHHLPADLPAAVFVVLHISPNAKSLLPAILGRAGALPAHHAEDGAEIAPGRIYVAPPDRHLLLEREDAGGERGQGRVRLISGPRENRQRPAVDTLFRSAARAFGPRVVGVVLSGTLDDGTAGLQAIKLRGGVALAQDPDEALFPGMPTSAAENVDVDAVLPLAELAARVIHLAHEPMIERGVGVPPAPAGMEIEAKLVEMDMATLENDERPGKPSPFACPECGGVLWELHDDGLARYRCRTGHAYSAGTLLSAQAEAIEDAMWSALRALEESESLARRLVARSRERGQEQAAARFEEQAGEAAERAATIRRVLVQGSPIGSAEPSQAVGR